MPGLTHSTTYRLGGKEYEFVPTLPVIFEESEDDLIDDLAEELSELLGDDVDADDVFR
ncbi:hypothetical protein LTR85_003918 [Meristemomyces frigidus]|nr:hypothetical protein LTR85_003918 [Meristemomyces frigidus]